MIKIAILGFGKVGQTVLKTIQENSSFKERFEVVALWNRSPQVFDSFDIPETIKVHTSLDNLIHQLEEVDLVVECAHPNIVEQYALDVLDKTNLFVSSPTAFADNTFRTNYFNKIKETSFNCYLPLGASVGVWDVIRLDQDNQLKSLYVAMKKEPDAFKIKNPSVLDKMAQAKESEIPITLLKAPIREINKIAPQNTNTMSVYALAASSLGFEECEGEIVADRKLDAHLVELKIETKGGLKLTLLRDNPANPGQVTGSATFGSFLNSLYHYQEGIVHNYFTFC